MPRSAQSPHLLGGEVPPAIELLTIHSKLPFRFVLRNELLSPPDPTHARSKFILVPPPLVHRFQFPLEVSDNEFIRNAPFERTSDEFENLLCHFRQPSATAVLQSGNAETNTLFIGTISGGIQCSGSNVSSLQPTSTRASDPSTTKTQNRQSFAEEAADGESHAYEEHEAENLHIESEKLLIRQMEDIQALAKKLCKAGVFLDDGALVKLNVSLLGPAPVNKLEPHAQREVIRGVAAVFGREKKRRKEILRSRRCRWSNLSVVGGEKAKEHLETIKQSAPHDTEMLFKGQMNFGPIIKHRMVEHLGELEDDDLITSVVEHLKDHNGPLKLVKGLELVLEEEAREFGSIPGDKSSLKVWLTAKDFKPSA
ncbi:hypothetical protein M404DRAFT_26572 [Pisolithus tinctorius Marx 270]|uniref:Uncharacterized protein n=1 Tax=Pisolithus tinctorius Marx 270 TaxID=870435 RepID=A0A0C3K363_PISTI|nr:hypothetical protein M404DRAFT_26572 [Pisolithus tinctorius Marx 270]